MIAFIPYKRGNNFCLLPVFFCLAVYLNNLAIHAFLIVVTCCRDDGGKKILFYPRQQHVCGIANFYHSFMYLVLVLKPFPTFSRLP